jgi:hypothetical protein
LSTTPTGRVINPTSPGAGDNTQHEAEQTDFAHTHPDDLSDATGDWWPESADGQCSEHAALFAASQPAPLNVV